MKKRVKKPECPNCGHRLHVEDNFCPECGQENHTHKLPLKHFALELLETTTHFDTKLWQTMKEFFLHPGLATKNFNDNKRARYVPPFRLYIFTSAIYFLLLSLVPGVVHLNIDGKTPRNKEDGLTIGASTDNNLAELAKKDTITEADIEQYIINDGKEVTWLNKKMTRLALKIERGQLHEETLNHKILKNISMLMFFLMPAFALLLMLFYYRKRLFYSEHLLFAVHFHTLAFMIFIAVVLLNRVLPVNITLAAQGVVLIYLLLSLKTVYEQSWVMTVFKVVLLVGGYVVFLTAGMALAAVVSIDSF